MKNTIYIVILVLILSCNKKADEVSINPSTKEQFNFSEDTLSKTNPNLDSISKSSKKELEVSSDTTSITINNALEIEKELNGVWNVVNISANKPDNIVDIIFMFNAKDKTLEVYLLPDELRGEYNYQIVSTDCENNKKNINTFYIKLSGDDNYCSKIVSIKHKNNKTYLILKDDIAETHNKEFIKISNDPKFFPKGFKN